MPGGGVLTIRSEAAAPGGEETSGPFVLVAVADTGCGMDANVLRRAVEPFFTTKEVGRGSGLGLSMVYGFVTQSGGHVDIASAPGEGCVVSLYLPVVAPPAPPSSPSPAVTPPRRASPAAVLAGAGAGDERGRSDGDGL
jgi:signal transduction histidine kinase